MPINAWSTTAASNDLSDSASGIGWQEGQLPGTVNESARAMMAEHAKWYKDTNGTLVTTGTGNAYVVTANQTFAAYFNGLVVSFKANRDNTAAATLNINAKGALALQSLDGKALSAGSIVANGIYTAVYDSGTFKIINMSGAGLGGDVVARVLPVGSVVEWTLPTIPPGWVWLTGTASGVGAGSQQLVKASYPELDSFFAANAYPYGSTGTNFTLPPVGGRYARAATTLGQLGTLLTNQNKQHTHPWSGTSTTAVTAATTATVSGTNAAAGAHSHLYSKATLTNGGLAIAAATDYNLTQTSTATDTEPAHTHAWSGTVSASTTATATTTTSGTVANDTGGTESRPDTVYVAKIMLANPAQAAAGQLGVYGLQYNYDTGVTVADPGAGNMRFNNATLASITSWIISETDAVGSTVAAYLAAIDNSTSAIKARVRVQKIGAPGTYVLFNITAVGTDAGTYKNFPITYVGSSGTIANGDNVAISVFEFGDKGDPGPVGPGVDTGLRWTYDTTITMADPTAGKFRLNNATLASVTAAAISVNNGESGNPSVAGWIASWTGSSSSIKGTLTFKKAGSPQVFAIYKLTASVNNTTWYQLTLTFVSSGGAWANGDFDVLEFVPTGDLGTGAVASFNTRSGAVVPVATDYTPAFIGAEAVANKNAVSGYAGLDASSKLTRSQQVSAPTIQVFTASGTWTKPAGCQKVSVRCIGAGGGGGGAAGLAASAAGGGGGGGGARSEIIIDVTATATAVVTIGAGGAAGLSTGGTGGTGGTTSFGAFCSAVGGAGGVGMAAGTVPAAVNGGLGGAGATGSSFSDGSGGSTGQRVSGTLAVSGAGGNSHIGGGGVGKTGTVVGDPGSVGGGGGGGVSNSATGNAGGLGGIGQILVEEFY